MDRLRKSGLLSFAGLFGLVGLNKESGCSLDARASRSSNYSGETEMQANRRLEFARETLQISGNEKSN